MSLSTPLKRVVSVAVVAALTVVGLGTLRPAEANSPTNLVRPAVKYGKPGRPAVQNVASTSLELSWQPVSGAPGYRIKYVTGKTTGYAWSQVENFTLAGLKKKTKYTISIAVRSPAVGSTPAKTLSSYSKSTTVTTSNYDVPAPYSLNISNQTSNSATVSWTEPAGFDAATMKYGVLYSKKSTMSGALKVISTTTAAALGGMSSNSQYYVRVYVMNLAGAQISDRSAYQLVKTLTIRGTITGTVTGAPGRDVQALAFTGGGDLVAQADVANDGTYSLPIRPGGYHILLSYLGTNGYHSAWALVGSPTGTTSRTASTTVYLPGGNQKVPAPSVELVK
jgi:hypothetical protein